MSIRKFYQLTGLTIIMATAAWAATERDLTPTEKVTYDKATHRLISPCCWREPIAIHRSQESLELLAEVRQLVVAGRSEEEIESLYVARYGERILADPPGKTGELLYSGILGVIALAFSALLHWQRVLLMTVRSGTSADPGKVHRQGT